MTARVSAHAAPGTYRVTFSCFPYAPHVQRVRITRGKGLSHRGELLTSLHFARHMPRPSIAAPTSPATPAAPAPLPPSPFQCITAACPTLPVVQTPALTEKALKEAREIWPTWESRFTKEAFYGGQCTELADSKRPDIVARVMETVIAENIMAGVSPYTNQPDWDAQGWDSNAATAGLTVGAAPQAGAIMVFHDSEYNHATKPGHVAYVDSVSPNGDIEITQEHAPELWAVTTVILTPGEVAGENISGLQFK